MEKYSGPITHVAQSKLEKVKKDSNIWMSMWARDPEGSIFQVQHIMRNEKYVVNLKEFNCFCIEWNICEIPCPNAVAYIGHNDLCLERFVH